MTESHGPPDLPNLPDGAAVHQPGGAQPVDGQSPAQRIRDAALRLGFVRVGFCPVDRFTLAGERLSRWLAEGRNGQMGYLESPRRDDPRSLLGLAQSVVVVALPHSGGADAAAGDLVPAAGLVARYALGRDYHDVLKHKLRALADECATIVGRPVVARPCVDTAPLLEREAARRAGIAFVGKSTMSILPGFGTYALLGELLVDVELPSPPPLESQCGRCTACLDRCPSGAFVDAYTLDARRCISYLTIELKGSIPRSLRPRMGAWVFGCDECQQVCPFNHSKKAKPAAPELEGGEHATSLLGWLEMSAGDYRRLVRGRALRRASRRQLQRNAAVALGNVRPSGAEEPLARALSDNPSPLVRGHAAWALGRFATPVAEQALALRASAETDPSVLEEIAAARQEIAHRDRDGVAPA